MVRKFSLILASAALASASVVQATPLPARDAAVVSDANDLTKGETMGLAIGLVVLLLITAFLVVDGDPESP